MKIMKSKNTKNTKFIMTIVFISLLANTNTFATTCPSAQQIIRSQNYWIAAGGWRSQYPVNGSAKQISFMWAAAANAINPPDGKLANQLVCEYIDEKNNPVALMDRNNLLVTVTVGDWQLIQDGPITHKYSWFCSRSHGQVVPLSPSACQFNNG